MSSTRLLILGLVRWMQPVHGYDVRRELESWRVEEWATIAPGSIYHALRKLAEEDLLTEVATGRVAGRPARTTYRVTPAGEAEFQDLLRRYWWEYRPPINPFQAAFAFLPELPRDEASAALRNRARLLRAAADTQRFALTTELMRTTKPKHVAWSFELDIAKLDVEAAWCDQVASRLDAGEELLGKDFVGAWGYNGSSSAEGGAT